MIEELDNWYWELKPKEIQQSMGSFLRHYEDYMEILRAHVHMLETHISAKDGNLTISVEGASITLKKGGAVVIKANDIVIEAMGNVEIKAGRNLVTKGSKIIQN